MRLSCFWGRYLIAMSQVGQALSLITLVMSGIAAYPTVKVWLRDFGIDLTFWQFGIAVGVVVATLPIAAWTRGTAGYFSQWNEQWWNNRNPLRDEIAELRKELGEIKKTLEERN